MREGGPVSGGGMREGGLVSGGGGGGGEGRWIGEWGVG